MRQQNILPLNAPVPPRQEVAENGSPTGDDALAAAVAAGTSIKDAARAAGVSERTAYRRQHDPDFRRRVAEIRSRFLSDAVGRLAAASTEAVSTLVRRRDRRCVTCGEARGLQCSHFFSRRHLQTRFDLRNGHAMCAACNRRHNVDRGPYHDFMMGRYGPGVVEELDGLRAGLGKVTDEELRRTLGELRATAWRA